MISILWLNNKINGKYAVEYMRRTVEFMTNLTILNPSRGKNIVYIIIYMFNIDLHHIAPIVSPYTGIGRQVKLIFI